MVVAGQGRDLGSGVSKRGIYASPARKLREKSGITGSNDLLFSRIISFVYEEKNIETNIDVWGCIEIFGIRH